MDNDLTSKDIEELYDQIWKDIEEAENQTIKEIKRILMGQVDEWLGYHIPEEGTEDFEQWFRRLLSILDFRTIDDLPDYTSDYNSFIIENEIDLVDAGMDPAVIDRLFIEELGEDIEEELDEEFIIQVSKSYKDSKVYRYGGKYFVFPDKGSQKRLVFENKRDALLSIGIDIGEDQSYHNKETLPELADRLKAMDEVVTLTFAAEVAQKQTFKTIVDFKLAIQERILAEVEKARVCLASRNTPTYDYLVRVGVRDALTALESNEHTIG